MSTSDQEQDQAREREREQDRERDRAPRPERIAGPGGEAGPDTAATPGRTAEPSEPTGAVAADQAPGSSEAAAAPETPEADGVAEPGDDAAGSRSGEQRLTPRQARHLRIALSSLGMAAMAVVLALRIASRSSVLVVGVYGLALILCGVVIELSRNGRTRLGSWLLGIGLVAAVCADQLLIP
ncbi:MULTISPECIES: hypothetical protein [Streptomyces]|uniref:Integral membrane protein n=1 Tax=Streptomyces clavifer TaxID=68188 RepID=A0ABS4V132_9ACTN|nr:MULTISPECIES: hypothetical protein [Streptomyces]MBP2357628.1 hypothetical protein [Streptomyces clavifer]MDX2747151.1 hypothetical protein [Streptomyces sp. NRRL_B-2557]GHB24341.1 hypothetical protein GCM10010392_60830 [Streptomyces clavifer]